MSCFTFLSIVNESNSYKIVFVRYFIIFKLSKKRKDSVLFPSLPLPACLSPPYFLSLWTPQYPTPASLLGASNDTTFPFFLVLSLLPLCIGVTVREVLPITMVLAQRYSHCPLCCHSNFVKGSLPLEQRVELKRPPCWMLALLK